AMEEQAASLAQAIALFRTDAAALAAAPAPAAGVPARGRPAPVPHPPVARPVAVGPDGDWAEF
ncbi:MAG: chemotaxis protein, partial [Lysobacteraceae bacterium]